ncbi:MAG: KpsF/GutQ family sugar-phosphate isomerase [Synergistaceae bacterium]|nr:KpsF/GutQ family sugar-phosphate isomerase [Synergistota bacterium]NLM71101.1 KpsF/GutQ family sugar-phosphate isomerase [Synergistaceae bacterium]
MTVLSLPWEREGNDLTDRELLEAGRSILAAEAAELDRAAKRIGPELAEAARIVFSCSGRLVTVGMGKSGIIGRKIAATLASLGTPSFFLHAAEGAHGDLGMVTRDDAALFISNSGTTAEVVSLLPHFKRLGAPIIAVTGGLDSPLARNADVVLDSSVRSEAGACAPNGEGSEGALNLAPLCSTTLQLALGDALAGMVTLLRGLRAEDFALFHPGGALGRRLLTRVRDVMGAGAKLPVVTEDVAVSDALFEMTSKGYGATVIVDGEGLIAGIFTDGDLRRLIGARGVECLSLPVGTVMTRNPSEIHPDKLAVEAVRVMEQREISAIIVADEGRPVGMVHLHELLQAGVA